MNIELTGSHILHRVITVHANLCRFKVTYTVVLGENSLQTSLCVHNTGLTLLSVILDFVLI